MPRPFGQAAIRGGPAVVFPDMPTTRITLLLFALAVLPFLLTACGKGGGGY